MRFSGREENAMRRALSCGCVSYGTRCISDSSGHAFEAGSRQNSK